MLPIGGVWPVHHIAIHPASLLCCLPWSSACSLASCSRPSLDFGHLDLARPFLLLLAPNLWILLHLPIGSVLICMSTRPSSSGEDGVLELAVEFQGLQISIRGQSDRALDFVQRLASARPEQDSSAASVASWEEIPEANPVGTETRASVEAAFPRCPRQLQLLSSSLSTTTRGWTPEDRVHRAWKAGNWAAAVRAGRAQSPNRTPTIDLPNKFYVVIRAPGISSPRVYKSSREFFAAVGTLEGSDTICHGFPSKAEAQIYLAGAGFSNVTFPQ